MTYSGWGSGGSGTTPWGGGGGIASFRLLEATPIAENVVRLLFSEPPYEDGLESPSDALDSTHYAITAVSGGVGLDGKAVRQVMVVRALAVQSNPPDAWDAARLDVVVDRPFSPYPCRYLVAAHGLRGAISGLPLASGSTSYAFDGLLRTVENQSRDSAIRGRDVAAPQSPADALDPLPDPLRAVFGSFNTDTTGDYAIDEGLTGLKKRCLRRIYCRKGKFVFLPPSWGIGIQEWVKRRGGANAREAIRAEIESQLKAEPDVSDCTCECLVDPAAPQLVWFKIKVYERTGRGLDMSLPFSTV